MLTNLNTFIVYRAQAPSKPVLQKHFMLLDSRTNACYNSLSYPSVFSLCPSLSLVSFSIRNFRMAEAQASRRASWTINQSGSSTSSLLSTHALYQKSHAAHISTWKVQTASFFILIFPGTNSRIIKRLVKFPFLAVVGAQGHGFHSGNRVYLYDWSVWTYPAKQHIQPIFSNKVLWRTPPCNWYLPSILSLIVFIKPLSQMNRLQSPRRTFLWGIVACSKQAAQSTLLGQLWECSVQLVFSYGRCQTDMTSYRCVEHDSHTFSSESQHSPLKGTYNATGKFVSLVRLSTVMLTFWSGLKQWATFSPQ